MKKTYFLLFFLLSFLLISSSCERKESDVQSTVEITVLKNGIKQSNITVHMFKDAYSENFGNDPIFARKTSVTNENGVAIFELQEKTDFEGKKTQTTKYFTILQKKDFSEYKLVGTVGLTLKRGENIKKTIIIN